VSKNRDFFSEPCHQIEITEADTTGTLIVFTVSLYCDNPGWSFTVYRGDDWVETGVFYDSADDAHEGAIDCIMSLNEDVTNGD